MHTQLYSENLNRKCSFEYLDLDKKIMFFKEIRCGEVE
jgi:hypothetical protein